MDVFLDFLKPFNVFLGVVCMFQMVSYVFWLKRLFLWVFSMGFCLFEMCFVLSNALRKTSFFRKMFRVMFWPYVSESFWGCLNV